MWAWLLNWMGFAPRAVARPVRVEARRGHDWNGTVLSMETYR